MAWKSPNNWFRNWLLNKYSGTALVQRFKDNFADGYDPGDILNGLFGISRFDENAKPMSREQVAAYNSGQEVSSGGAYEVGQGLNDLTGVSASQTYMTEENDRQLQRDLQLLKAQQDFSAMMSNTAIQRQKFDAEAAGVNPLYLYSGSGNTGAGLAVPSGGNAAPAGSSGGNSAAAVASAISSVSTIVGTLAKMAIKN